MLTHGQRVLYRAFGYRPAGNFTHDGSVVGLWVCPDGSQITEHELPYYRQFMQKNELRKNAMFLFWPIAIYIAATLPLGIDWIAKSIIGFLYAHNIWPLDRQTINWESQHVEFCFFFVCYFVFGLLYVTIRPFIVAGIRARARLYKRSTI